MQDNDKRAERALRPLLFYWWTIKDSEPKFAPSHSIFSCSVGANSGELQSNSRGLSRAGQR